MKYLFFTFLVLLLPPHKFKKVKVNNQIEVKVSQTLTAMSIEQMQQQTPTMRKPLAGFTSSDRLVDYTINRISYGSPDGNLTLVSQFLKAGILNLFDFVDIHDEGEMTIHKKKFIFFEFSSRMKSSQYMKGEQAGDSKYHYLLYYPEKSGTIVFSFQCPRVWQKDWQPVAHQMIKGIKIK